MNAGFKILADRRILEIHRQVPKSGLCRQWADAPAPKRWEEPMIAESAIGRKKNGVTFTEKKDMDIDSFKKAVDGVDDWFVQELKKQGYNDGQDLVDLFTK